MAGKGVIGWILQMAVGPLLKIGQSITGIFNFLRPTLPNLTQSRVAGFVREYEVAAQKTAVTAVAKGTGLFAQANMIELDMPYGRRYRITYEFEVYDKRTGLVTTETRRVYEQKNRSIDEMLSRGVGQFDKLFEQYEKVLRGARVTNVYHNEGWAY
jgi:hypothetical protein